MAASGVNNGSMGSESSPLSPQASRMDVSSAVPCSAASLPAVPVSASSVHRFVPFPTCVTSSSVSAMDVSPSQPVMFSSLPTSVSGVRLKPNVSAFPGVSSVSPVSTSSGCFSPSVSSLPSVSLPAVCSSPSLSSMSPVGLLPVVSSFPQASVSQFVPAPPASLLFPHASVSSFVPVSLAVCSSSGVSPAASVCVSASVSALSSCPVSSYASVASVHPPLLSSGFSTASPRVSVPPPPSLLASGASADAAAGKSSVPLSRNCGVVFDVFPGASLDDFFTALTAYVPDRAIVFGSRVAGSFTVYFSSPSWASTVCLKGVTLHGSHVSARPVSVSPFRVTVSNVPPEIPHAFIRSRLQQFGQVVGPVRYLKSASKLPRFSHVFGFRRSLLVDFSDRDPFTVLPRSLSVFYDNVPYVFYLEVAASCSACGATTHVVSTCPRGPFSPPPPPAVPVCVSSVPPSSLPAAPPSLSVASVPAPVPVVPVPAVAVTPSECSVSSAVPVSLLSGPPLPALRAVLSSGGVLPLVPPDPSVASPSPSSAVVVSSSASVPVCRPVSSVAAAAASVCVASSEASVSVLVSPSPASVVSSSTTAVSASVVPSSVGSSVAVSAPSLVPLPLSPSVCPVGVAPSSPRPLKSGRALSPSAAASAAKKAPPPRVSPPLSPPLTRSQSARRRSRRLSCRTVEYPFDVSPVVFSEGRVPVGPLSAEDFRWYVTHSTPSRALELAGYLEVAASPLADQLNKFSVQLVSASLIDVHHPFAVHVGSLAAALWGVAPDSDSSSQGDS